MLRNQLFIRKIIQKTLCFERFFIFNDFHGFPIFLDSFFAMFFSRFFSSFFQVFFQVFFTFFFKFFSPFWHVLGVVFGTFLARFLARLLARLLAPLLARLRLLARLLASLLAPLLVRLDLGFCSCGCSKRLHSIQPFTQSLINGGFLHVKYYFISYCKWCTLFLGFFCDLGFAVQKLFFRKW